MTLRDKYQSTLGNPNWIKANEKTLKDGFPETWTLIDNIGQTGALKLGYKFKLLGLDWRNNEEFGLIMAYLVELGIYQRQNGYQFRANPSSIFS